MQDDSAASLCAWRWTLLPTQHKRDSHMDRWENHDSA